MWVCNVEWGILTVNELLLKWKEAMEIGLTILYLLFSEPRKITRTPSKGIDIGY